MEIIFLFQQTNLEKKKKKKKKKRNMKEIPKQRASSLGTVTEGMKFRTML